MDIEALGARFGGKVTFWGEMDRQHSLPFGTPEEVRRDVQRVRRCLGDGRGGLIALCEWGKHDPFENIRAMYAAWSEPHL
jgi:uroporphyrinogen decarboxylase